MVICGIQADPWTRSIALYRVLFEVWIEIDAPLIHLFKFSVETVTLPYDWKIGEITVIQKNGSKVNVSCITYKCYL